MFLKEVCIYLILNTVKQPYCKILLQCKISVFYVNICWNVIYFCDQSCIFSIITAVFSVTWSSEIIIICWFTAQETFLIIINVENSRAAQYFCVNCDSPFIGKQKKKKEKETNNKNNCILQGHIKLIKSDSKNAVSIHKSILKKKCITQKYSAAQLFLTLIIIRNVS